MTFTPIADGDAATPALFNSIFTQLDSSGGGSSVFWYNVSTYGTTGDGVADDTSAVSDALAALVAAGGGVLYFPAGTYLLSTWTAYAVTVPIKIMGEAKALVTIKGPDTSTNFLEIGGSMEAVDATFERWQYALHLDTTTAVTIERTRVAGCRFESCDGALYEDSPVASRTLEFAEFIDSDVDDYFDGVALLSACDHVNVSNNKFTNGRRRGIQIGDNDQSITRKNMHANNNTIDGIDGGAQSETQGIILLGERVEILGNIIKDVDNNDGTDLEGIYTKARYGTISNNVLIDAGRGQAAINIKGNVPTDDPQTSYFGDTGTCQGNVIAFTDAYDALGDTRGIYIQNDWWSVTDNVIRDVGTTGIRIATNDMDSIRIENNYIYCRDGVTDGIRFASTTGGSINKDHIVCRNNVIQIDDASVAITTRKTDDTIVAPMPGTDTNYWIHSNIVSARDAGSEASVRYGTPYGEFWLNAKGSQVTTKSVRGAIAVTNSVASGNRAFVAGALDSIASGSRSAVLASSNAISAAGNTFVAGSRNFINQVAFSIGVGDNGGSVSLTTPGVRLHGDGFVEMRSYSSTAMGTPSIMPTDTYHLSFISDPAPGKGNLTFYSSTSSAWYYAADGTAV
jgi:hypothetical protein